MSVCLAVISGLYFPILTTKIFAVYQFLLTERQMLNGFSLMWTCISLPIFLMVDAFGINESQHLKVDAHSKRKLVEIRSLEKKTQGEYPILLKLGNEVKSLKQVIELNYCQMSLKTYHPVFGFLSGDVFDLRRDFPFKTLRTFKSSYGIFFGLRAHLKERSRLYFKTKKERNNAFDNFKQLSRLCKKRSYQDSLVEVRKLIKKKKMPNIRWVKSIPEEEGDNSGAVQTEGFKNYLANLDGRMSLKERYRSLMEAKKSILIQTFIFRADESGKFFTDLLVKRKSEGLDVRVNFDGVAVNVGHIINQKTKADLKNQRIMLNNLMSAGIRVFGYSCKRSLINEFRGFDLLKIIRRNHEKMWLVDSELALNENFNSSSVGILGGVNIAQEYFALSFEKSFPYRDQDIALRGPLLKEMRKSFERSYLNKGIRFKTYHEDKFCLNPFDPIKERVKYEGFKKKYWQPYLPQKIEDEVWEESQRNTLEHILLGEKSLNEDFYYEGLWRPREIEYFKAEGVRFLHSRPDESENYVYQAYINLVNNAKNEILISNGYLLPPDELKKALLNAIKRGVEIRFLTNGVSVNNLSFISKMNRYRYVEYFDHSIGPLKLSKEPTWYQNISIHEWMGRRQKSELQESSTLHNKYMIVDGKVILVGSFNLDYSSLKNSELGLIVESRSLAQNLKSFFERDLSYSRGVSKEDILSFRRPQRKDKLILYFLKLVENHL